MEYVMLMNYWQRKLQQCYIERLKFNMFLCTLCEYCKYFQNTHMHAASKIIYMFCFSKPRDYPGNKLTQNKEQINVKRGLNAAAKP